MVNVKQSAKEILVFQAKRAVTNSFKESLNILEELEKEHAAAITRLILALPPEYQSLVKVADYWHDDKRDMLRKRILTAGNDAIRTIEQQADAMDIAFL